MVALTGGYYGTVFHRFRGVAQWGPLYLTISNVVVDAVVRKWVAVVVERLVGHYGRGQEGRHQISLF